MKKSRRRRIDRLRRLLRGDGGKAFPLGGEVNETRSVSRSFPVGKTSCRMRGSHSSEWRLRSTERDCTDGCMRILPLIRRVPRQLPPRGKPKRRANAIYAALPHAIVLRSKSDIAPSVQRYSLRPCNARSAYHAAPPHITAQQYHSPQANRTEKTVDESQRFFLWRAWRDSNLRPTGS